MTSCSLRPLPIAGMPVSPASFVFVSLVGRPALTIGRGDRLLTNTTQSSAGDGLVMVFVRQRVPLAGQLCQSL